MEIIKNLSNLSIGDVLDLVCKTKSDENKKLYFKNIETEEVYNLEYQYVVSEVMYLYVYKNVDEKTVGRLNCMVEGESNDECWNSHAMSYLEDLTETEYSEDDYRFSSERIESGDLEEERLEVVKNLPVFIVADEKEDINKLDDLLDDELNIKDIREVCIDDTSVTILFR